MLMQKATVAGTYSAKEVSKFWIDAGPDFWFSKDPDFDREIKERFLPYLDRAAELRISWPSHADGAFAFIILCDQMSRNMFRGQARAFATDPLAREVADLAIAKGFDKEYPVALRKFFYLPYMHHEDMESQKKSVDIFFKLGDFKWVFQAVVHAEVIRMFGRYPHRNKALGRVSKPGEECFLDSDGFAG